MLLLSFFYRVWLYVITLEKQAQKDDLWRVAATSARSEIRGTEFGTDEMNEMCEKMGCILSAGAQKYLDEVDAAVARGDAYIVAAMANCPSSPSIERAIR